MTIRLRTAIGSTAFFFAAPFIVAGVIPLSLAGWDIEPTWLPLQVLGGLLVAAGGAVLIHSFARFVIEGLGTPAPVAPTENLVVGGLYRYVRNPMYVAVVTVIAGQALLLGEPALLVYGAIVFAVVATFVRTYEEPVLSERYGEQYEAYRRAVPAWLPRPR
jgi:protein-S-isoprenylcysteine O-methyltransferase Ste14